MKPEIVEVTDSGYVTFKTEGVAIVTMKSEETMNFKAAERMITIEVVAESLLECVVNVNDNNLIYTGEPLEPVVVVKKPYVDSSGKQMATILKENVDYTLSFSNNINAGTGTVTVTGAGNYLGTLSAEFEIKKAAQTILVSEEFEDVTSYNPKEILISDTISIGTVAMGEISYSVERGYIATISEDGVIHGLSTGYTTISIYAAECDNYLAASKQMWIRIMPIELSPENCEIILTDETMSYDVYLHVPVIIVKYNGELFTYGEEYCINYTEDTEAGTGTITVY